MTWTLLIVDDDDEFRSLARALLDRGPLRVVGEAADCHEALARVAELRPEVVVVDIGLPDGDGFMLADRLADGVAQPAVVLVSSRDERSYRARLHDSHVRGFIPEGRAFPRELGGASALTALADILAGVTLLACGVAAYRQPARRAGDEWVLLLLTGSTWLAGSWIEPLVYAHRGPLVHLLLSHPGVRPRQRSAVVIVVLAYIDGLVPRLATLEAATLVLAASVLLCALARHRTARGRERRSRRAALWAVVGVTGVLGTAAAMSLLGTDPGNLLLLAYDAAVAGAGLGLAADLLAEGAPERAMAGVVADLGEVEAPGSLRRRLAAALGDPELVVAYRLPVSDSYVDEAGRPVSLPTPASGRTVTAVEEAGERIAVIVHDDVLSADEAMLTAAAGTVRLTTANARMQAEIRARISETAASSRRLVTAADDERRRFEALLRAGAERQLELAATQLDEVRARAPGDGRALSELDDRLERSRHELRRFAMGVHPAALAHGGLEQALADVAADFALPIEARVVSERFDTEIETAAYFTCVEALANVAKHASASRVELVIERRDGCLGVVVRDDGVGGASKHGSGLRGLADRVEALGGRLSLDSPEGAGTRLVVELPLAVARGAEGAAA